MASEIGQAKRKKYVFLFLFNYPFAKQTSLKIIFQFSARNIRHTSYLYQSMSEFPLTNMLWKMVLSVKSYWYQKTSYPFNAIRSLWVHRKAVISDWTINHNIMTKWEFQRGLRFERVSWYHFKRFHTSKLKYKIWIKKLFFSVL